MKQNLFRNTLVISIIILFFGISIAPIISGISFNNKDKVELHDVSQDSSSLTFYTFNKTDSNECSIDLSFKVAEEISDMIEDLKYKIINEPFSQETKSLKSDFIELLDFHGLLPRGMTKEDVFSLLNPFWLEWFYNKQGLRIKTPLFTGFNSFFNRLGGLQRFFFSSYVIDLLGQSPNLGGSSAILLFCSLSSLGNGLPIPLFLLPRPRGFVLWSGADYCVSNACSFLSGRGFIAQGIQTGVALGFIGVGVTFSFYGSTFYAFIGYATFVYANAAEIGWYHPPNAKPVISDVNPANGAKEVPISLSELSFRINDANGDRMDYSVTTSPDIGSGNGVWKKNGVYKIPVSGLEGNTDYNWTVVVNDKYDTVKRTFSFTTEKVAPVVSDPVPVDGDSWVPVDISSLSFRLKDNQGDLMDYTIETSPDVGSSSGSAVGDGVYSLDIDSLESTTDYTWFVNVTDGTYWTREVFRFKTQPIIVFDPFDEGWSYRKKITVNHNKVAGDLSDFPVLVSVVDSDLSDKAQSDGDDILFMDGSGVATRLFHEIELYDDSNGELVAWVKLSDIDGDVDTVLYIYYGNPFCDSQQYPDKVWDSHYMMVHHMQVVGDSIYDSTINNNDGALSSSPYNIDGVAGKAIQFDGIDDAIDIPYDSTLAPVNLTYEIWGKVTGINSDGVSTTMLGIKRSIDHWGNKDGRAYCIRMNPDSIAEGMFERDQTPQYHGVGQAKVNMHTWYHFTLTFDEETDTAEFFFNGFLNDTDSTMENEIIWYNGNYGISLGKFYRSPPRYYDCTIDEFRISDIVRSSTWINTSFENQDNPSSFMNFGPEETGP